MYKQVLYFLFKAEDGMRIRLWTRGIGNVYKRQRLSEYIVTGGFAEVTPEGVTVIAERAMVKSDVTQEDMDGIFFGAKSALDGANEATQDAATKTHADVMALAAALGLSAA